MFKNRYNNNNNIRMYYFDIECMYTNIPRKDINISNNILENNTEIQSKIWKEKC
jgi:hypothetical protein